jgi:hypothetical protein
MISGIVDTLVDPRFLTGIAAGIVMLGVGLLTEIVWHGDKPAPYGGLLLTVGALAALAFTETISIWMIAGIPLLGLAGLAHRSVTLGIAAAIPGAALIIVAITNDFASWVPWFALVAIIVAAPLVASFDSRYDRAGLPLPFFAVSTLGVYLAVPDTELAIVLFGTAAVVGFLGWPKPVMSFGAVGAYAAVGLYVAAASIGAVGRPASLIAAVACLGLTVVTPVAHRIFRSGKSFCCLDGVDPVVAISGQLVLVLLISRTAGRLDNPWPTVLLCTVFLTGAAVVLAFVHGDEHHGRPTETGDVQDS